MAEPSDPPPPPIRPAARDWLGPALVLACLGALVCLAVNLHQAEQIETLTRVLHAERDARDGDRKQAAADLAAEKARHGTEIKKRINKRLALMSAADVDDRGPELDESDDEFPRLSDPEPDDRLNPERQRADLWEPEKLPDDVLHADDPGRRKPGGDRRAGKQVRPRKVPSGKRPKPADPDGLPPRGPGVGPPVQ
jgi:hypothetical protein